MEYNEKTPNPERTRFRYALGVLAPVLAWPTLIMPVHFALTSQFLAFSVMYFADSRATALGWAPQWYGTYRFVLTFIVGSSILVSLIFRAKIDDAGENMSARLEKGMHQRGQAEEEFTEKWSKLEQEDIEKAKKEAEEKKKQEAKDKKQKKDKGGEKGEESEGSEKTEEQGDEDAKDAKDDETTKDEAETGKGDGSDDKTETEKDDDKGASKEEGKDIKEEKGDESDESEKEDKGKDEDANSSKKETEDGGKEKSK